MRKLVLSLSVALASLLMLASIASAQEPDWSSQAQYKVNVMGTDLTSGGYGLWMGRYTDELADRWQRTYNWNPTETTTVYLYSSGAFMATALGEFRGSPLTEIEMREVAMMEEAFTVTDRRPASMGGMGGRAILVNLTSGEFGPRIGSTQWMNAVEAAVVHELAHLMVNDVAGAGGPMWLHVGIANYLTQNEVPEWLTTGQRNLALSRVMGAGIAPGIVALHNDWNGVTGMSRDMSSASYAVATKTVQALVPTQGLAAFLNLLRESQGGGDFNARAMRHLGRNLNQLDLVYRSVL